jgi:hypothetical protein
LLLVEIDQTDQRGAKTMTYKPQFVDCKVSLGNFESEFYVVVNESSAFVSRQDVKVDQAPKGNQEVHGKVLAYIITEERDRALVQLPGEPVVGGLRAWVAKSAFAT